MAAILYDSTVSRKSARSFGRGAHLHGTSFEPSDADREWAAELFDRLEQDRRHVDQALDAEWTDRFNDSIPAGCCRMCSEPSDWLDPIHRLCGECLTAAEDATIAGENSRAGLGHRVF
jgi:hypothetical protein